jgi:hypothetical protein
MLYYLIVPLCVSVVIAISVFCSSHILSVVHQSDSLALLEDFGGSIVSGPMFRSVGDSRTNWYSAWTARVRNTRKPGGQLAQQ